ncbi:MAG: transglycosylase SLT domain-containing protein [Chitinivibrionales bacterium]
MALQTNALSQPDKPQLAASSARHRKVAREFEAMFASMMLKAMRSSVDRSGFIPQSTGEQIYTEMLDKEYASVMAKNASFGLSDLILRELEQNGEDASHSPSLSSLRSLSFQPWMNNPNFMPQNLQTGTVSGTLRQRVEQWRSLINDAGSRYDLDPDLISAVVAQESAGNPMAISTAGAKGLMQLMDGTAGDMGVKQVFNPHQNISGGSRYLRMMLDRFGGNEQLALAAYNAGPSAVERYEGVPPYQETQKYVKRVLEFRERFAQHGNISGER